MESLCYSANKESEDADDVSTSLTAREVVEGRKRPTLANPVLAILIWPIWFLAKTNFGQSIFGQSISGSGVCHGGAPKGGAQTQTTNFGQTKFGQHHISVFNGLVGGRFG